MRIGTGVRRRGPCAALRDPDVRRAVEESLEGDACFGAREGRAGTRVDAVPERDLLAGIGAIDR